MKSREIYQIQFILQMKIDQLNVSFIWTRTFFQLFDDAVTETVPFGFFAQRTAYTKKFVELFPGTSQLTCPWEKKTAETNWFWKYYLGNVDPLRTDPSSLSCDCLNNLIPFRKSLKLDVTVPWSNDSNPARGISFEGFFYRHGVALVCTLRLRNCQNIEEAVDRALEARYHPVFSLHTQNGEVKPYSMTALSENCLDALCQEAINCVDGYTDNPFSVAAVASGNKDYEGRVVQQGDEIHKALEALASWDSSWKTMTLPELTGNIISIKKQQPEDVLYGHENSRVLWSPRLFVPVAEGRKNYALRWYYRNLVMASMHARSLSAFLVNTNKQVAINGRLKSHAKIARDILLKLQNPDGKSTYRTKSLKVQIENDRELQTALTQLNPRIN